MDDATTTPSRRGFINWFLGTSLGALTLSIVYPILRYISPPHIPEATTQEVEAGETNDPLFLEKGFKIVRFGAEPVIVETHGDRQADVPIWELGGRGVFVREVQAAVLEGRADFAVHSAKDLPSSTPEGLTIAAIPKRADARDALVGARFDSLFPGARVGTGSVRRRAQLAWLRPDLTFGGLRGNMETRLAKVGGFAAIVVAAAALERLGRSAELTDCLPPGTAIPKADPWIHFGDGKNVIEMSLAPGQHLARRALEHDDHLRRVLF